MLLWTFGCMHLFELWFSLGIRPVMGLLGHNLLLSRFPHLGKFFIHSVSLNIHKDDLSNTIVLHLLRLLLWCHASLWPTLLFLVSFAVNHLTTALAVTILTFLTPNSILNPLQMKKVTLPSQWWISCFQKQWSLSSSYLSSKQLFTPSFLRKSFIIIFFSWHHTLLVFSDLLGH